MRTRISAAIDFDETGNAADHLLYGWSVQEPTHIWSVGQESALVVDAPGAPCGYLLEINWRPHTAFPLLDAQTVTVRVNGQRIYGGAVTQDEVIGLLCPAPPADATRLVITFEHPDAACPRRFGTADDRVLALLVRRVRLLALLEPMAAGSFSRSQFQLDAKDVPGLAGELERVLGASVADVVARFEMLCGNCDMGLAQRGLGFEPLSLLRFAGTYPAVSIKGLDTSFAELGTQIEPWIAKHEWMITDHFGLQYHTGQLVADIPSDRLIQMERTRIAFLRRKFLEDIETAEKVFIADRVSSTLAGILPLFCALNRQGPRRRLLWIIATRNESERGLVEEVLPGLFVGRMFPYGAPTIEHVSLRGWLEVLGSLWQLINYGNGVPVLQELAIDAIQ
jgi:hypothetical protein